MTRSSRYFKITLKFLVLLAVLFIGACCAISNNSSAATIKLKINGGKTKKYKKKQFVVKYNNKTVSKKKFKGIIINGYKYVAYDDVLKKCGIKATISSNKKTITASRDGQTALFTIKSKTAKVNDSSVKMKAAPAKVRFVSKKKTKYYVPIKYVSEFLHLNYTVSKSTIYVNSSIAINYNNADHISTVDGKFKYNDNVHSLKTMPVVKAENAIYVPVEEVCNEIMGLEYNYDDKTGKIVITNNDTGKTVKLTKGELNLTIDGKDVAMKTPALDIKRLDTQTSVLCIPANVVLKGLGYSYTWNKKSAQLTIQSQTFFDWKGENSDKEDSSVNYIKSVKSEFVKLTGGITFSIAGTNTDLMNKVTVKRNESVISIKFPATTKYNPKNYTYEGFIGSVKKFEVINNGNGEIEMKITSDKTLDFAYTNLDNTLTVNVMLPQVYNLGSYELKIPKPTGTTISNVTNEDLYSVENPSYKFKIMIKGSHAAFFKKNPAIINSNVVKKVSVSSSSSKTTFTIKTSKLQGYKIYETNDSFVVNIGNPKKIYKNIIVLDAGHGGYDSGATNKGTKEKDLTFKMIYTLMKKKFASNAPTIKAYWTRRTDKFITLASRAAFASKVGADVFVSLHMNSASNGSANGTEVYYSTNNNKSSFSGITSKKIASLFKSNLVNKLGMKSRGVKTAGYYVTKRNTVPAVLIELGFLSGSSDYGKLVNSTFQSKATNVMYNCIESLFSKYSTGR
ncbi:MAG: N-acetylmuramoyl-L-alanine amidase [Eubacterium sp.]|nr:N-acetylmuramoyl-L-alanine amidase [Eubacterium sp.]